MGICSNPMRGSQVEEVGVGALNGERLQKIDCSKIADAWGREHCGGKNERKKAGKQVDSSTGNYGLNGPSRKY
ncbi:hypothetical protein WN943_029383 [Citrus x changshan-huyou]